MLTIESLMKEVIHNMDTGKFEQALTVINQLKAKRANIKNLDLNRARCFIELEQPYAGSAAEQALLEELSNHPDNKEAQVYLKQIRKEHEIFGRNTSQIKNREFLDVHQEIRDFTMLPVERLYRLWTRASQILKTGSGLGEFHEYGTARGGTAAMIAYLLKSYRVDKQVKVFDSFEGLPPEGEFDTTSGQSATAVGWGEGTCYAGVESLEKISSMLGVESYIEPIKGYYEDTLPKYPYTTRKICFAHVDCDWFDSIKIVLNHLLPALTIKNYIQIDDFGYWDGVRKATEEAFSLHRVAAESFDIDGFSMGFEINGNF